jgi:hypothetical protein
VLGVHWLEYSDGRFVWDSAGRRDYGRRARGAGEQRSKSQQIFDAATS